ncbi:hypothetical protein EUGRSUZ_C01258 [Eucalyptus grandis]|uniref:Uncharacterized protein n=2 Tax=Eucalyptus grandis TaxID=71139 RepID=A0ACC3LBP4_EUCGR|nr:hypothetical protein EUGRSUZ_C01258 [Eucalyptus grandis]
MSSLIFPMLWITHLKISWSSTISQDIRRELGMSTFEEGELKLATITRKCEKCDNDEFEYTRKQMRSADEGQTTFLTCTKCRDTITEN